MKPIGLAFWGLHHQHPRWYWPLFQNLPQFQPLAIGDADAAFLDRERDFFKLDPYTDPRAMLARPDVEAVMIFLPHSQMPAAVKLALAAGKHVLVEKPMGATVRQVRTIAALAAKAALKPAPGGGHLKVTTGYCWRFDPMARQIKEWLAAGLLGTVTHFEGRMTAGGAWRYVRDNALWMLQAEEGGGPMYNLGVHWIDLFHWWTGLEVAAVQGRTGRFGGEPVRTIEDSAYALLEYAGGAVGVLDISYSAPPCFPMGRDLFVSIRGTLGLINWYPSWGGDDHELLLASEHESMTQGGGAKVRLIHQPTAQVPGYCGQMGLDYLADWAAAIRADRPVAIPVADGLRAVEVAEAALKSAASGRRVRMKI